jgi:hypothetical protein
VSTNDEEQGLLESDRDRIRERFDRDLKQIRDLIAVRIRVLERKGLTAADMRASPDSVLSALTSAAVCMRLFAADYGLDKQGA